MTSVEPVLGFAMLPEVNSNKFNFCSVRSNLEVHHKEFRSQGGDDSEENLITLCVECHSVLHREAGVPFLG
jgi:5-methylcytosine-specific restriction endonuclease McrA